LTIATRFCIIALMSLYNKLKSWWKEFFRKKWANGILAFFVFLGVRFIQLTSWTSYRNVEPIRNHLRSGKPVIAVLWHSRSLFVGKIWSRKIGVWRYPLYAVFSAHRDGRFISNIYRYLGIRRILANEKSPRERKKVVFKILRKLDAGYSVCITPDGPRGPVPMKFNTDSAFLFALKSGAPIVPVYMSASRFLSLKTWDKFMVVKPFSRSVVEFGDFVWVKDKSDIAGIRDRLTEEMTFRTEKLDKEMQK